MYYYIFEPTKNPKEQKIQDEIKAKLTSQGIVGEFVTLSLAEEPRDLARVGLRKNYTTVVACGSDLLINEVAAGLIESEAVFGIIPTHGTSNFHLILGTQNYLEACDILPQRKVLTIDVGLINRSKIFLTHIKVMPRKGLSLTEKGLIIINFDSQFSAETQLCDIDISNIGIKEKDSEKIRQMLTDNKLDIFVPDQLKTKQGFFSRLFGKKEKGVLPKTGSIFHRQKIGIESRKKLQVSLEDKIIERGNLIIESFPESLKIIVKRERPVVEEEDESE